MRRLLAALALTAFVVACGDSTSSPKKTPVGAWSLSTIDGAVPPFTIGAIADTTVFFDGSTLTIGQDGRFSEVYGLRYSAQTGDSVFTQTDTGTWTLQGTTLTFNVVGATPDQSGSYTGDFRDSTIVESGQNVWVYRRK